MTDEQTYPPEPQPRKRHPAGAAMVAMVVALLLGSLFNAERIDRTAHTQPYGWQRTWAIRVTGPVRSVSQALGLTRVREEVAERTGHETGPDPIDTRSVITVPPPPSGTAEPAPSTTTTTVPITHRTPNAEEPLRLAVVGDSLVADIGGEIARQTAGLPVQVTEEWKVSSGLARPDYFNWPAHLAQVLGQHDPEVVVMGFGANDDQPLSGPDGVAALGTEEWKAEYQRRVAQILDVVEAEGRTVYWVGLPVTDQEKLERTRPEITSAVETELSARPWAHLVDTVPILSPDGTFTSHLPGPDGDPVRVRASDGVHATMEGVRRITRPIVEAVVEERDLS